MKYAYYGKGHQSDYSLILRLLDYRGPIGCDVETVSIEDRRPLGLGFAISPDDSFYFPIDSPLLPWNMLADPSIPIIFHNSAFDVNVLETYRSGFKLGGVDDTCIAALLLGLPGKLSTLCLELFARPERPITDLIGSGVNQITMDKVDPAKVAERACLDSIDALDAWNYLKDKIPQEAYKLEMDILPDVVKMENRGIRIDKTAVQEHMDRLNREATYLRMICEGEGFNPGSSKQLAAVLEAKGYKILRKKGKDGKLRPRLDKNILETFYAVEPLANMALKYRSTNTLRTHLIGPLSEGRYLKDDHIHPRMNLNVTQSGRISRSNPATQNIKNELRNIIIPEDNELLLSWDFSQIELRWAAYMFEDKRMLKIFKDGGDVHMATAAELIEAGHGSLLGDTPKKRRDVAKEINYTVTFGGGAETLYKRRRIPIDQGKALITGYFERFNGMARGIEELKDYAIDNGYTETTLGRRRDGTEKLESGKEYLIEAALRELVNHPIQGSAAETLKKAMLLDSDKPQFHTVHDEMVLSVPYGYEYSPGGAPAPFDTPRTVKIGMNWRDMNTLGT